MTLPRAILALPNDGLLTVARELVRRGVEVVALTDERYRYVLAARGVRGRVMPHLRRDPATWLAVLDELAARGGGVVLSGSDEATTFLTRHRARLDASLRTFESADGAHLPLMDKLRLYGLAEEAGVRVPWLRHVRTVAELAAVRDALTYPCVLKPVMGHLAKDAIGVGTARLDDEAQLLEHADRLLEHGIDFLLTELVPGPETALEGAVTVRDADGRYPLEYSRRKLRQWPPDYGIASLMETTDSPDMLKLNRQLLDYTGFVGVSSCEAKRHPDTGDLYLIEINVRVPASFGLAQASGADGPWRLYATLAGLPLGTPPPAIPGRRSLMHADLLAAAHRVRRGDTTVRGALRSWRGTRDFGVFAPLDPGPALVLAEQVLRRAARRLRPGRR